MAFEEEYKNIYETVSEVPQLRSSKELKFFLSLIPKKGQFDILDIGCANGLLSMELSRSGYRITAMDISSKYLKELPKGIRTIETDIQEPLPISERFDFIYFLDVIEHLPFPTKALQNIGFLLKENGSLFISTPSAISLFNIGNNLIHRNKIKDFKDEDIGSLHLCIYDALTLRNLLYFSGFGISKIFTQYKRSLIVEAKKTSRKMDFASWSKSWRKRKLTIEHDF